MPTGIGIGISTGVYETDPGGSIPPPPVTSFEFNIDTTKAGSAADTFVLPLISDGVIDIDVWWGDGTTDTITVYDQAEVTHVYAASGTYTLSMAGTIRGWSFNSGGDKEKILNISKWGDFNFTSTNGFKRCTNLTCTATDIPANNESQWNFMFESCPSFNPPSIASWDMSSVTRTNWMFFGCSSFNQPIGSWNTSANTNISYMLYGCTSFDQDLSAWDVSSVTDFSAFLTNGTLSTVNYDALLVAWDAQAVSSGETPNFGNSIYTNCSGEAFTARNNLISSDSWTITDGGGVPAVCPTPFEFGVDTTNPGSAADTFVLPLVSDGVISIDVDWGDGDTDTITTWNQAEVTHVYGASGTYTIQMTGTIRGFKFNDTGDAEKILDISEWGDMNITQSNTFYGCTNLTATATDAPTISSTNLMYMFAKCDYFNTSIDNWDVSGVTNMQGMFWSADLFNQDLNSWNVADVTTMNSIFSQATAFTGDISAWTTTSLLDMTQMFYQTSFNGDITAWNTSTVTNTYGLFRYNTAFNQDISSWDMSSVLQMGTMFDGATAFDQDISGWNVSACTNMWGMFSGATSFDQDLGGWDVSNVTATDNFLQSVTLSTANYDSLLSGWNALSLQSGNVFSGGNSIYTNCGAVEIARDNIITSDSWTITDGGGVPAVCTNPFTFEVKTDNTGASNNDQFKIPLVSDGTINFNVDWGDGSSDTITTYNQAEVTHTYAAAGTYTIEMEGTIRGWRFFWGGDPQKVLDISKWGDFDITQQGTFAGCTNLSSSATDYPALSGNTLSYAFYQCTPLNMDVSGWNVSSVTKMGGAFTLCSNFTGVGMDVWNVSSVTSFSAAFYGTAINEDISGWNTSSCTDMGQMFSQNAVFNQDIGSWDVSNVTSFGGFLQNNQVFNQDLSLWDTSSVTGMNDMFYGCLVFDSDISSWDVSNVTNFQNTFNGCTAFSADLSSWSVTSVCERTIGMFQYATSFDADISGWDVSGVEYFISMFRGASNFDQDIGVWDTGSALSMDAMFRDASNFDQDLSSWNIGVVADFDSFMQGVTLSTANYDALLVGWEGQPVVSGITINFGSSKYTDPSAASTARADLIAAPNLWTITDGGIA